MLIYVVSYLYHDMFSLEEKPVVETAFQTESAAKAYCQKRMQLESEAAYSYEAITLEEE